MGATFHRLGETHRPRLTIWCDDHPIEALEGDTLLTAILTRTGGAGYLRKTEFDRQPRAGFCLMGACNDCIVWTADGGRLRACSTPVREGLRIFTRVPEAAHWPDFLS